MKIVVGYLRSPEGLAALEEPDFAAALIHAGLGQPEEAARSLWEAVQNGSTPAYPYWFDPRFADVDQNELRRMAATEYARTGS